MGNQNGNKKHDLVSGFDSFVDGVKKLFTITAAQNPNDMIEEAYGYFVGNISERTGYAPGLIVGMFERFKKEMPDLPADSNTYDYHPSGRMGMELIKFMEETLPGMPIEEKIALTEQNTKVWYAPYNRYVPYHKPEPVNDDHYAPDLL